MNLFDETCFECSKLITQRYSTSFSLGIKAFSPPVRGPIYAIYGFVRYADEIVDTFHGYDKEELIAHFRRDARKAIEEGISLNPVLHSFQLVVNRYHIEWDLIDAFLRSMEMDLDQSQHIRTSFNEYVYGSAEVVGLMCLRIFTEGDKELFDRLSPTAKSLGAAFQKINFLRDLRDDFEDKGRVYFPNMDFSCFNEEMKSEIEEEIKKDFQEAYQGIKQLPDNCRLGVYIAYRYYLQLFKRIKSLPAKTITQTRIRVPDSEKVYLFAKALLRNQFNAI
jgi:phytoene/squalene synthetase